MADVGEEAGLGLGEGLEFVVVGNEGLAVDLDFILEMEFQLGWPAGSCLFSPRVRWLQRPRWSQT